MIACPKCGADTRVMETRDERRTRVCMAVACGAKFVTVELPVTTSLVDAAAALRGAR